MKKASQNKYVILAHINQPELTYHNVFVPDLVPLLVNFDQNENVGAARLKQKGERIYAILEMTEEISAYGNSPSVALGLKNATQVIRNGTAYVENGVVSCASLVSNKAWSEIYGEQEEENVGLD